MKLKNRRLGVNNKKRLTKIIDWLYEELLPYLSKEGVAAHYGLEPAKLIPGLKGYECKFLGGHNFEIKIRVISEGRNRFGLLLFTNNGKKQTSFNQNRKIITCSYNVNFVKENELKRILMVTKTIINK